MVELEALGERRRAGAPGARESDSLALADALGDASKALAGANCACARARRPPAACSDGEGDGACVAGMAQPVRPLVPPDGGWGWMVVLGVAVCNGPERALDRGLARTGLDGAGRAGRVLEVAGRALDGAGRGWTGLDRDGQDWTDWERDWTGLDQGRGRATTQSLLSVFGLLFFDTLEEMGAETTGAAVISNSMVAITNFSGLMTGPVMRRFTYRQVAMAGGVLVAVGMFFTSMATKMWHLFISYSVLVGLGLGLLNPSTFVAVNAFFTRARGRAVGLFRGAVLILSAVALHSIAGAMLFHPLRWHARPAPADDSDSAPATCPERQPLAKHHHHHHHRHPQQAHHARQPTKAAAAAVPRRGDVEAPAAERRPLTGPAHAHDKGARPPTPLRDVAAMGDSLPVVRALDKDKAEKEFIVVALQDELPALLATSALCGFVRGATTVNHNLAVSESCSPEKLPGALGLNMVIKGISILILGLFIDKEPLAERCDWELHPVHARAVADRDAAHAGLAGGNLGEPPPASPPPPPERLTAAVAAALAPVPAALRGPAVSAAYAHTAHAAADAADTVTAAALTLVALDGSQNDAHAAVTGSAVIGPRVAHPGVCGV
ncbi:Putative transmembrane transport [Gryllus bimaculatus]|nr:Putative transmembrane transport [Gryllus bimaculatus]